jgi:parallel beta-helix repeat protein
MKFDRTGLTSSPSRPRSLRSPIVAAALAFAGMFFWVSPSQGRTQSPESSTFTLTCGPDKTIAQAIKRLKPGDTLLVSGTCNENLVIGEEVDRITLDGQGTAAINGDSTANAITVNGSGITIRGFVITGGAPQAIAVQDGAAAVIDGNTVQFAARNGIAIFRGSSANIINNTIQHNGLAGIAIQQTATARIGWSGPPNNRVSAPNTIQSNGTEGIQVYRGSSAQIFSNTIRNNGSHGVFVDRNAQAEIAACTITGNVGDGIRGMRGAGVDTGTDATGATPQFDDDTNTGTNGGFGVRCAVGGFVDGRLGALTGALGGKSFAESCVDSLVP